MSLFGRKKGRDPNNPERAAVLRARAAAQEKTQSAQRFLDDCDLARALPLYIEAARLLKLDPDLIQDAERWSALDMPRRGLDILGTAFYRGGFYQEALPMLEFSARDGEGSGDSFLPLAALYVHGVPGLCEADLQTAKLWYDRWLKTISPGSQTEFGRYPQCERLGHYACFDEQGEHSYNGGLFEPVTWDVLDVKDGRVLLLSRRALEYKGYTLDQGGVKELFPQRLFHPAEYALVEPMKLVDEEEAFLLSAQQFTQYICKEKRAEAVCSSTVCASCNQAVAIGLDAKREENGYRISGASKNISFGIRYGPRSPTEWLHVLTSENVPWLLSDDIVSSKGELMSKDSPDYRSPDRIAVGVRPAVWVRLPRKVAGKGRPSLFSRKNT